MAPWSPPHHPARRPRGAPASTPRPPQASAGRRWRCSTTGWATSTRPPRRWTGRGRRFAWSPQWRPLRGRPPWWCPASARTAPAWPRWAASAEPKRWRPGSRPASRCSASASACNCSSKAARRVPSPTGSAPSPAPSAGCPAPSRSRTSVGTRSRSGPAAACSPACPRTSASTSCTPTPPRTAIPPSPPSVTTASRSPRRSSATISSARSSTPRSPDPAGSHCSPTSSTRHGAHDPQPASRRRPARRPGRPPGPGRHGDRNRLRRPGAGRQRLRRAGCGLAARRRPGRRLRSRPPQPRPARPRGEGRGPGPGGGVRRRPHGRRPGRPPRSRGRQGGHRDSGARGSRLGPGSLPAPRRRRRGRPGRPRPRAPGAGLDLQRRRPVRDPGPARRLRLPPLRLHRGRQGRHADRPGARQPRRGPRRHGPPGDRLRRRLQPGRPARARPAGRARPGGRHRRQGAVRRAFHGRRGAGDPERQRGVVVTLARRVVPCLDVTAGRVVKGVSFVNLVDAGDPVELAAVYDAEGADELVFLDITATVEARATLYDVVSRTAEHVGRLLRAGADKLSVTSAAVRDPELLSAGAATYGAQCMVLAIDARRRADGNGWEVVVDGGRTPTGRDALAWAEEGASRGAGELLVTSMDADGQKTGYDLELVTAMTHAVDVPVIASGGAGNLDHFVAACQAGADAVLAASVFHFAQLSIAEVKRALASAGLPIRT